MYDDDGSGVPGALVLIIVIWVGIVSVFSGAALVHDQWRQDAIERCSKTHGQEWCTGRATLEKW